MWQVLLGGITVTVTVVTLLITRDIAINVGATDRRDNHLHTHTRPVIPKDSTWVMAPFTLKHISVQRRTRSEPL